MAPLLDNMTNAPRAGAVGMLPVLRVFRCLMSPKTSRLATLAGLALLLAVVAGCSKTFIPNTDVLDTVENRKVILFCETYRHAVEEKNVGQLLKLASPAYHRKGVGNNDDDVDYVSLKEFLTTNFQQTDAIRYEIRYRRVTFEETSHVHVDYTFAASYRVPGVKKEEWRHAVADNRLELVPEGDGYKIIAGM
jgi:hypothetical protein